MAARPAVTAPRTANSDFPTSAGKSHLSNAGPFPPATAEEANDPSASALFSTTLWLVWIDTSNHAWRAERSRGSAACQNGGSAPVIGMEVAEISSRDGAGERIGLPILGRLALLEISPRASVGRTMKGLESVIPHERGNRQACRL